MLPEVEQTRMRVSRNTEARRKAQLGQFLTPAATASFMAGLFAPSTDRQCRLLDAGAGIGSLSHAFLEGCRRGGLVFDHVALDAFELDEQLHDDLTRTLSVADSHVSLDYQILGGDFIETVVNQLQFGQGKGYSHAILNPPYKKIGSASRHRLLLRQVGIETVNLYSAFVALALALLAPRGQLVAIIPRSFCNGPYYRPFRKWLLEHAAIRHIHLFASRAQAFKDDDVLQENVIIRLERGAPQAEVTISTSTDDGFADLAAHQYPFARIVAPDDPEQFIHVPTTPDHGGIDISLALRSGLAEIGVQVSTGPVVDFRLKVHLRDTPEVGTVPLLYPVHCNRHGTQWPNLDSKKPNAIQRNADTEKWLYPIGFYCVVRRFSSKEEKRRIVASVVQPDNFANTEMLGFENHLNVFHEHRHGLPEALAHGLALFLNSSAVDESFRSFNGHTQVNATDLKRMRYPSRAALIGLGLWAMRHDAPSQAMIDEQLAALTS